MTYKHCLSIMMCRVSDFFQECQDCPRTERVRTILENIFQENAIENVTFQQWISSFTCILETMVKPSDEFIDLFISTLNNLQTHSFIATQ
ncbi:hypothetical protein C0J52_03109 [Blattella germanica]|nr:hypothetical protein C0J52_03109 [Blattella germanica]